MAGTLPSHGAAVVVQYDAQPMDCALHPMEPLLAAALISGRLTAHRFEAAAQTAAAAFDVKAHSESCRSCAFSPDGRLLLSASADQSLLAVDAGSGKAVARLTNAHAAGIDRLTFVSDAVLASGDEEGGIRLWDTRQREGVGAFDAHTDFISDMTPHAEKHVLLAVSGDGTLSVNDLRTLKVLARSEDDAEEELLSVAVLPRGKKTKVVAGALDGVLNIFSWGYWNDCSDRLPGHPASVDAMVAIDDSTVATASSDGLVRLIGIQPHKMLGVLGRHGGAAGSGRAKEEGDAVEALAYSSTLQLLASAGHDDTVRLWDLAAGSSSDADDAAPNAAEDLDEAAKVDQKACSNSADAPAAAADSDDDDSDSDAGRKKKRRKKGANKGAHKITHRGPTNASFFADL